jgi:tRNA pseudouridine55 synthase
LVIAESDVRPSQADVEAVLPRFTGPISQIPPAYSALKIDGQRAYDLARAGEEVVLKERAVVVYRLVISHPHPHPQAGGELDKALNQSPSRLREGSGVGLNHITLTAHVSKGTYIRSLARDIALALGTVGHVTMLRRTKAGPFTLDTAITLDNLEEYAKAQRLEACLLPLRAALDDIPALPLTPDQADALRVGRPLNGIAVEPAFSSGDLAFAMLGDTPIALVKIIDGIVTVERGFNM